MKLSNNKILITGGATGIGLGLTKRFIEKGNTVIICGRRASVMQEVADQHPAIITKVCDVSIKAEREALYHWIETEHSDTNVLINNAGIQQWMQIDDGNFFDRAHEEIAINVEAPIHLAQLFINLSALQTIVNVTSGLSFVPLTKTPVYSGTKAFLHSFTCTFGFSEAMANAGPNEQKEAFKRLNPE